MHYKIKYLGIFKNRINYYLCTHFSAEMTHVDNSFGQAYLKKIQPCIFTRLLIMWILLKNMQGLWISKQQKTCIVCGHSNQSSVLAGKNL
jgi:hypothetical protein